MTQRRIVIHTDGRLVQGNERQIDVIARGLIGRGHEVHISARPGSPAWEFFTATGARLSGVRPRGTADVASALRFARWLRSVRPDALLLTSWRRMWIAGMAARAARVPNVVMRLGGRHDIPAGLAGAHYRDALLRLVHRVYTNSTLVRDHLRAALPALDPARIHIVWNAIETPDTGPAAIRAELAIPAAVPLVAAVGGLARLKGFDVLLDALARVDTPAHVVICGTGGEQENLERQARELGIGERVHLAGQRSDVPAILAAADAFVLSSRTEGFSVALLEAMHAGLPIVATDVGGVRDALGPDAEARDAGWIVPPGDAAALANALVDVLPRRGDADVRARVAEARRRARERYTVRRMVEGVERVLLEPAGSGQQE